MSKKLVTAALTAAASLMLLSFFGSALSPLPAPTRGVLLADTLVRNSVLLVGAGLCLWYLLTAVAVILNALLTALGQGTTHLEAVIARVGAPLLRRAVHVTAASTLVLTTPAFATPPAVEDPPGPALVSVGESRNANGLIDLGWASTDPPPPTTHTSSPAVVAEQTSEPDPSHEVYVVEEGDTLWAIAKADLVANQQDSSDRAVAEHWPRWHSHNRSTIGPDPDLIISGQRLHAPSKEES